MKMMRMTLVPTHIASSHQHMHGQMGAHHMIEIRGRWKHQGQRLVFRYIDVKQLFINAKVAAALCIEGLIKDDLVDDAEV